jgi:lipoprotein signal peptidase
VGNIISIIKLKAYFSIFIKIFIACILDIGIKFLVTTYKLDFNFYNIVFIKRIVNNGFLGGFGNDFDISLKLLFHFTAVVLLIIGYIFMYLKYGKHKILYYYLVFVLSGSFGSFLERSINGYVTDWIRINKLTMWFNLSDLYLISGALLYIIFYFRISKSQKNKRKISNDKRQL